MQKALTAPTGIGCGKSFLAGWPGFEIGRPLQRLGAYEFHRAREESSKIWDVFGQATVACEFVVVGHAEKFLYETADIESQPSPGLDLFVPYENFRRACCTVLGVSGPPEARRVAVHPPVPSLVSGLLSYIVTMKVPKKETLAKLWNKSIPDDTHVHSESAVGNGEIADKYELRAAPISS